MLPEDLKMVGELSFNKLVLSIMILAAGFAAYQGYWKALGVGVGAGATTLVVIIVGAMIGEKVFHSDKSSED